ncbi:MAG: RnfH family protein [Gammaproteobacteria bacterium]|nr:RnfH family protein [Gammaproteobacteria bacterium]
MVQIEVVYALPERQWSVDLELEDGTSAEEAADVARNSEPLLWVDDLSVVAYAVWGVEVSGEHELKDGDRLELLRPLPISPVELRRQKAASQKN